MAEEDYLIGIERRKDYEWKQEDKQEEQLYEEEVEEAPTLEEIEAQQQADEEKDKMPSEQEENIENEEIPDIEQKIEDKFRRDELEKSYKFVSACIKCNRQYGHDYKDKNKLCPLCDPKELKRFRKIKPSLEKEKIPKPKDLNTPVYSDLEV